MLLFVERKIIIKRQKDYVIFLEILVFIIDFYFIILNLQKWHISDYVFWGVKFIRCALLIGCSYDQTCLELGVHHIVWFSIEEEILKD